MTRTSAALAAVIAMATAAERASAVEPAPAAGPPASAKPPTDKAPAAGTAAKAPIKVTSVEGITEYRLENGLKVLLFPDASKPTVTVNVTVLVGSRHEGYGESGMAHLLEHMLFKGTPTHGDIWKLLQDRGATFNGTTWWDRTNYYEQLPATGDNLEFALRLEADRLVNSKIAAEDLAKEFSVVRNEFEMGENHPAGVLEEKLLAAAYQWHNYGKSPIGPKSDIERVPVDNLRVFYRRFYQPDNAVLIVAGKFEPKTTLALIGDTFGRIPRPARALPQSWTEEPVQDGERTVVLRRQGDVAVVSLVYHGVAGADPDWIVEDAITDVLANKPAGRLYKALVEKGLASEVSGVVYPTAEPGFVLLSAKVRPGGSPEKVRDVMIKVVESLGRDQAPKAPRKTTQKVTKEEVDRWRARSLKEIELALTDSSLIGVTLSDWAAMGDWRLLFQARDRIKAAAPADLDRVAANFLKESNRTTGMFLPTKTPERAPEVKRPDVAKLLAGFKGEKAAAEGEVFAATIDNVEKRTTRFTLPSGMKVALLPKKTKGAAVGLTLTVRYGTEKTLKGTTAAAQILAPMLMRGTRKRTYQQIKDELDRLRAEMGFGGGRSTSPTVGVAQARAKTVRDSLPEVIALMSEILRSPAFPKSEFETLRKEALAHIEEQLQDPSANAFTTLTRRIAPWPKDDVRYVPTLKESAEWLGKVRLEELVRLHKTLWGSGAAQMAIVGDFDADVIRKLLEKELGGWKAAVPFERVPRPYRPGLPGDETIQTPDKQMAFIALGHPIEARDDDPDFPALIMLDHLLGGSASSRLLERLRQKEGISYGAFSRIHVQSQDRAGYFFCGALAAPQNVERALTALDEEISKLRKDGPGEKELADGKKSYAASFDNDMADDGFIAGDLAKFLYLGRTFDFWKRINDRIARLTAADIVAAAQKHIDPSKLARVVAGDLKNAPKNGAKVDPKKKP